MVQLRSAATLDEQALRAHVREQLAGFKTPKRVLSIENLGRAANGKADYKSAVAHAAQALGAAAETAGPA